MIIILLLTLFITSCTAQEKPQNADNIANENHFEFISSLNLPQELSWCGEKLPLDIPEVRERAEREFYLLLQQPGQIILYLKRAGRYFPLYEKMLAEENMPDDLKYLSVAESALYMSFSVKGAAGLWQFMPETGKRMGLIVNDDVDERLHPEKSTKAALKYLKNGYIKYKSWTLTAAGYNMGFGNVESHLNFQTADNYFDLFLNEETSRFIFRIALIKELMSNAPKYGFIIQNQDLYHPEKVRIIKVSIAIVNLSEWAAQNSSTYKHLRMLNPWIRKKNLPKPPAGVNWEIVLPE